MPVHDQRRTGAARRQAPVIGCFPEIIHRNPGGQRRDREQGMANCGIKRLPQATGCRNTACARPATQPAGHAHERGNPPRINDATEVFNAYLFHDALQEGCFALYWQSLTIRV